MSISGRRLRSTTRWWTRRAKQRTRTRTQRRALETILGTVEVERTGYGAEGEASLHPLDAQLNLPDERYSLEVRRRAALEASKLRADLLVPDEAVPDLADREPVARGRG